MTANSEEPKDTAMGGSKIGNAEISDRNTDTAKASNTVTVDDTTLTVTVNGLDRLWSFTKGMKIPLAHVMGATVDPGMRLAKRGAIRTPGLSTPGKHAGTFKFEDGDTEFWNIQQPEQPLVIQLRNEKFDRLILGVADPRDTADAINNLLTTTER
ncbi:hypothetical protein OZX74_02510 [Bifidobacterium sp. ESL0798]|uniref:hypothetical protein n=1 Tax=Bifidobacterium sp. ESL0798 TaxID=2983235 RepID=UPI0023F945FA|nr:hypothetical protein [Bifidobacterium sp. ESL0798]WEV74432.1 hypothetical protein OZX74_02510 [Bifidobacterium sp. ESL0798]